MPAQAWHNRQANATPEEALVNPPLTLFQRIARNLRWYGEDIVTAVSVRARPFHFAYGNRATREVNPTTGQPMTPNGVDVTGATRGTPIRMT